ncbi:MAG: dihydrodipicolinate synthase family protein [Rhodospirillales bacterium]|jgi:dihydrodipicolinate synthase/N-acetylneuraminate lyase|nr:dihydrodipicolinate synthase family protein [Rhodospirillales bacterium]
MMTDHARIRDCLTGPVSSIRTPFLKDGAIDWDGLRRVIDFNIAAGSRTMLLTAGDSHYFALSDDEIAEVTRVTVQHTARRAMVVAADRHFNTGQAVAFARFCREVGADVLMVMPPDWAASGTPETLAAHYKAVSAEIPVMLVTNVFIPRGEAFGLAVVERALEAAPDVVAVKDDMLGPFARKMTSLVQGRWAVLSGGQKQNHLDIHPYGCDGYLSTFITFKPGIAHRYWAAIQRNDMAAAVEIIRTFDWPFFKWISALPGGFDAGIHGVLELAGICWRWRRPPYCSLSDEDMERLGATLKTAGIL